MIDDRELNSNIKNQASLLSLKKKKLKCSFSCKFVCRVFPVASQPPFNHYPLKKITISRNLKLCLSAYNYHSQIRLNF